ncbi:FAD-dependent oxidoreductase [Aliifodinibius salipaludis]|uniref:FAD-dependent oxidoreductase n=1 Tax=Fodinibius salipaludis TaxID=2032627 RepID=A0A2A2G978_9BACT|nr:FAD-dependent oxidoreductase [Aliifodinibius salipaludis]PAU94141.1 FAD-dependent oxidoreductase [Aliifodinibius salipaludis]
MSYSSSFWEKDSFLKPYDLAIVGAGIVGLSSALFYKQQNPSARVAVLERGFLPQGASTRNAGFACVGSIGEHLADMEKDSEENIKERIKRRYEGLELLKQTLGEEAIGYEHCGGYEFFKSRKKFEKVSAQIDRFNGWMRALINENEVYSKDELQGYPVIRNRLEGALHPGKMMEALAKKVSSVGVDIKWNSRVEDATKDGIVSIANGLEIESDKVLFAANGFVQRLLPELEINPARGFVMVTNEQENFPWKGIFHHDRGYVYFRNVGNRLLIGGARNLDKEGEQTDQFGTNGTIKLHLKEFVSGVLGCGSDWNIDYEWSGIMGFSPTKTPIVKQLDRNRFVAAGLSGMGIAIGMEVGRGVSEMLES